MLKESLPTTAPASRTDRSHGRPRLAWLTAFVVLVLVASGCANSGVVESEAALEPLVIDNSAAEDGTAGNDAAEDVAEDDAAEDRSANDVASESVVSESVASEPVTDSSGSSETGFPDGWDPLGGSESTPGAEGDGAPGGDTASNDGAVNDGEQPEASIPETLAFSADATSAYSTMLFAFDVQMGMSGEVLEMTGQGAVDGQTMAMQMNLQGLLEAMGASLDRETRRQFSQPMTMITTPENVFVKWAPVTELLGNGKEWVYMPPDEEATPVMNATLFDPSTFVDLLHGASDDVTTVGTKEIDGQTVTGYTGTFSLADQLDLQGVIDESSGAAELGDATTTVWISSDDLVRQIESDFVLLGLSYRSSFTFSAYGEPVNIDVPTIDQAVPADSVEGL